MLIRVVFFDKFVAPEATIFALPAILSPGAAAGLVAAPIRSSFSLDWESLRALEVKGRQSGRKAGELIALPRQSPKGLVVRYLLPDRRRSRRA